MDSYYTASICVLISISITKIALIAHVLLQSTDLLALNSKD